MRYIALWLSGVIVAVFVLQYVLPYDFFVLIDSLKWQEPYRLLLSVFAHASVVHLLNNLVALVLFGLVLEGRIGPKRVFWLFIVVGILVNIISPYERSLGASGAIYGILGALVALRPTMVIYTHYIPMPMFVAGLVWLAQDIFGIFYPSNVANLAHISGLFLGLAYGLSIRKDFGDSIIRNKPRKDAHLEHQLDNFERIYMRKK